MTNIKLISDASKKKEDEYLTYEQILNECLKRLSDEQKVKKVKCAVLVAFDETGLAYSVLEGGYIPEVVGLFDMAKIAFIEDNLF